MSLERLTTPMVGTRSGLGPFGVGGVACLGAGVRRWPCELSSVPATGRKANNNRGSLASAKIKPSLSPSKAPVLLIVVKEAAQPFEIISMNFIMELPKSKGFDSIFVVVDQSSTKGVVFMSCNSTIMAEGTADLYREHVWKRFRLLHKQIPDCGPQFATQFIEELCKKIRVKRALSTAFYPQTNGETERVNQELKQYLRAFCNFRQDD